MSNLPLRMWAAEDTPTYKIENRNIKDLSDVELLSIIVGSGTKDMNSVELMRNVLAQYDNQLQLLARTDIKTLKRQNGIGTMKAAKILAAAEIGRRTTMSYNDDCILHSATSVYMYMVPKIGNLEHEEFWALYVNQRMKLVKAKKISQGGLTETTADIRIILKEALLYNATNMFVCHNHPSGSIHPSGTDDKLTSDIRKASEIMRIRLLDHVIVTDGNYYSYHEEGKL